MHKISIEKARDQQAGQYLGRLHMAYLEWLRKPTEQRGNQPEQSLSTEQYHALLTCQSLHNDFLKAIGSLEAYYEPHLGSSGDEDAHANWCGSVIKSWESAKDAIQRGQNHDKTANLWAALDLCVLREESMPHLLGSIRTLANVLKRHFQRG